MTTKHVDARRNGSALEERLSEATRRFTQDPENVSVQLASDVEGLRELCDRSGDVVLELETGWTREDLEAAERDLDRPDSGVSAVNSVLAGV